MDPLILLLIAAGGLVIYGKSTEIRTQTTATQGNINPDRDAALHDSIVPLLDTFIPGTQAVADVIGEEAVEDISNFMAEVDDLNRQNLTNFSNDLAELDDQIREDIESGAQKVSGDVHKVGEKIFGSLGLPW